MALGASDTTEFDKMMGALGMLSGSKAGAQKAFDAASAMYAPVEDANPWEASLRFFLEMGKQASQPGATVLGSAVGSGLVPLDYLTAKKKEKRDRDQKVASTAFSLAPTLKPKAATYRDPKEYMIEIPVLDDKGKPTGAFQPAYRDFLTAKGFADLQKQGARFKSVDKPTGTGKITKPFDVKITDEGKNAFALAFPNATLPENGVIALRSDQLSTLPVGGYEIVQDDNTQTQSALTDYKFSSLEGLEKFKASYPDVVISAEQEAGIVPISLPNSISNNPSLLGALIKFQTPRAGSQYERLFSSVNDIGTRLAAYVLDPNNAPKPTQAELNEYAANYQKLVVGGEFTEIVDGKEVTRRKPGIDLSATTNLPIPEGLDLNAIIEERSQKFTQTQSQDATFGSRMLYNEGVLRNSLASGYVVTLADLKQIAARERLGLGNIGADPLSIQFHIAAQNWAAANLRKESGAAIGPKEYSDALLQYFPQVGDGPDVLRQKQALRDEVTRGMINASGDAFKVIYPSATQYLKYMSEGTEYDILNPQGYANDLIEKARLGQNLFFKDTIAAQTVEELRSMLANKNAATLYTQEMINMIAEEIKSRSD